MYRREILILSNRTKKKNCYKIFVNLIKQIFIVTISDGILQIAGAPTGSNRTNLVWYEQSKAGLQTI